MEVKLNSVNFSEIQSLIDDENITDIDWNGSELWIKSPEKGSYKSDKVLSEKFIRDFVSRLANLEHTQFNEEHCLLEAETEDLRISCIHSSCLNGSHSIAIRKIPLQRKLEREAMIKSGYCTEELCNFFEAAVKAHCNIVVGGLPSVGKTEFLKWLTTFIPDYERAITIEDNYEIHYRSINPGKDCVEIKVNPSMPFSKAIKGSLRHNAFWLLLSEARGKEIVELMNGISDGCCILTTIHTNDSRSIPDRMLAMSGDFTNERFIDIVHNHLDVGIIIDATLTEEKIERCVSQVAVYSREFDLEMQEYKNEAKTLYNRQANIFNMEATKGIERKLLKAGISNPFLRSNT